MGNHSVVLPIACLSAIVAISLAFIWWFFPKWYKKGIVADMREIDEMRRERDLAAARAVQEGMDDANGASRDVQHGEGQESDDLEAQRRESKAPQVTAATYRPTPVTPF